VVRARLLVVAVLMLTVPMHGFAAVAAALCLTPGHHEAEVAHDHGTGVDDAAHDHAANDASDSQHCGAHAPVSISAAPTIFTQEVPQAGVVPALLPSPGRELPGELDRPPLLAL
jgi:hypothetical protein